MFITSKVLLIAVTVLALSACVSDIDSVSPTEPVVGTSQAAIGMGAVELKGSSLPVGGFFNEPCRPAERASRPTPLDPQIEIGLVAPSDGRDALFGDYVPYAGYRCN